MIDEDPEFLLEHFGRLASAQPLLERLGDARADVYLVGGAIRDLMLGTEPRELDLLTEFDPERLMRALGASGKRYGQFGTATVEIDGFRYDLARARRESYAEPGALPTVAPATVADDLSRRDFTVNAIAMAVFGPSRGALIAADHARDDLRSGALRVLHDESFKDDPTRLLRLALYSSRLKFAIEPGTLALARSAILEGALGTVSGERIGAELQRLACEPDPVSALGELHELGIDAAIAPGYGLGDRELARRALALLPEDAGDRATLILAAAGLELAPGELSGLLARLGFEAARRDAIVAAAARARPLDAALRRATTPSEVAAAVDGSSVEAVALAGALGAAEPAREWLSRLRRVSLEIGGRDLLDAGVPSGRAVGEGLRAALAAKLDGRARDREAELAEALRAASGQPTSLDDDAADDDRAP